MSIKKLKINTVDIKNFCNKYFVKLDKQNTLIITNNNIPIGYLLSPKRFNYLLKLELMLNKKKSEIKTNKKNILLNHSLNIKFKMHKDWYPGDDFIKLAKIWGINLYHSVTPEELSSFRSYWQQENRLFYHIQWQQKLARNVEIFRKYKNNKDLFNDYYQSSEHEQSVIPFGFRG